MMDKHPAFLYKTLVVGVIVLFIGMSLVTSNCTAINNIKSNIIDTYLFKSNSIKMSDPPVVEILYPEDGSTIYTRYTNFSVKFTDDNGMTTVELEYGGKHGGTYYSVSTIRYVPPPSNIFYFNESLRRMLSGYVWIVAKAYDEDGNVGIDTVIFYYNDSNDTDLYPPEIEFSRPDIGYIYIFGREFPAYPGFESLNYSIVLGKFKVSARIEDIESNLQKVEICIDNKVVYEEIFFNYSYAHINWDCNKFLIGMHEIKIVATDSYNNSAMEKFNCFIFNIF